MLLNSAKTKQLYTAPSVDMIAEMPQMNLLGSLSANLVFEDMEDGGEIIGEEIDA